MLSQQTDLFGDLPDALIGELLTRASSIGSTALNHVEAQVRTRERFRERARSLGLIENLPDLSHMLGKSVAAVDGSLVSKRLASFDLNAAAALAVDGIGFDAHKDAPRHDIAVHPTRPLRFGREITYALMFCMEYDVAYKESNTRDLVMLDGAFSTGLIAISKALISAQNYYDDLSNEFFERWTTNTMRRVIAVMASDHVIAIPKRPSANEFATQSRLFESREIDTDGRSTASMILEAGEFSVPFNFDTRTPQTWPTDGFTTFWKQVRELFEELRVVYFKPHPWSHAYRVEIPRVICDDEQRLHSVLDTIKRQCASPAMMEPYPLYVADRFAKSLAKGADALLDAVRQEVTARSEDPSIAYAMLNTYRTDPILEEVEE